MGTRSSYRIIEKYDATSTINDICVIYVHYDGYPKGHPLRICKWLSGSKMSLGYNKIIAGSSITNGKTLSQPREDMSITPILTHS